MAAGEHVWDGAWNLKPDGACMRNYPIHSTSRQMAGGPITGDIFKCELQPLERAISKNIYGPASGAIVEHIDDMRRIFPDGVCNFNAPDEGRPKERLIQHSGDVTIAGRSVSVDYREQPENVAVEREKSQNEIQPTPVSTKERGPSVD